MAELFLDANYAVALGAPADEWHTRAMILAEQVAATGTYLVTTQAVLLEIGDGLSKARYRSAALRLLFDLTTDPQITIIPLTEALFAQAFQLYQERPDKEWGLTDCISFIVMQDRGITAALTGDHHFEQAGFRALLREPAA